MANAGRAARWVAAGIVALAAAGGWWWQQRDAGPATTPVAQVAASDEPFAVLDCKNRLFEESSALALTFSQPIRRGQSLDRLVRVIDLGPAAAAEGDRGNEPAPAAGLQPSAETPAGQPLKGNWVVGDNPRVIDFPFVQPQRRYAVIVDPGLQAAGAATLGAAVRCDVATEAMPPSFYFASRGVVLPAGQNGGLPVVTVNAPEVDVQFLRIDAAHMPDFFGKVLGVRRPAEKADTDEGEDSGDEWRYAGNRSLKGSVDAWDLDRLKDVARSVYQGRFLTDDRRDRRHVTFLPVENIDELKAPGIYIAVMSQPGRFRSDYQVTYFYVSEIGLHMHRYAGRIDAFATSLKSGRALDDVQFELLDDRARSMAKADADAQGHGTFAGDFAAARLLLARRAGELSVVALQEPALDLSEFDVGGYPSRNVALFPYAGRDLYRPGERFELSVLARDADGRPMPAAPLTATLKRPDGRTVRTESWQPEAGLPGYFRRPVALPADAQTGSWLLELRVDPAARRADAAWKFQVEEFLPERMKLDLQSGQATLEPGQPLRVDVQGGYLFGAPAAGNRLLATVDVSRDAQALPTQWPGFLFGDFADDDRRHRADLDETTLDEHGAATVSVPVEADGAASPMKVRAAFSLLETGGRPVVRSIERILWPAPAMIGVRPLFDRGVAAEGQLAGFEAVRVDAEGRPVPLAAATVRLYREERQYYWRFDDQRGWNSGFTETEELVDARTLAIDGRTRFELPVKWGRYRLEIGDPGHGPTARYRFYAGWGAQDAEDMGNRPDRVQLKLGHAPVREGETVRVDIAPPHDGEALVAVEGGELLWSKRVAVKASGTRVEIPIGKDWHRHDLYVSVAVFRPGSAGDHVTPSRALGLAHLPLARDDRKLMVAIEAPPRVLPERRTEVKLRVSGAQAAGQAYVTLSAVDAGILNITGYPAPDPFDFFFGKHRYAPELLDMYGKLIEKMDGTPGRLKWGGDAAPRETRSLPTKVRLVDLFSGPVRLDAQGQAVVPLDLPDFNGSLRLMAVAADADRFGSAQADMVVAAPVVAELATPRFISPGDRAALALDLTNLSGAPQTLSVRLDGDDPLRVADGARSVRLQDRQRTTLRFFAEATGAYGLGRLRLKVDGDGAQAPHIARESWLQVEPAVPAAREIRRLRLAPGESTRIGADWAAGLHPGSATVGITLSNRPPFNAARLVQGLLDYPYGCTEQTASAAYPDVLIDEAQARALDLTPRPLDQRRQRVDAAIARLAGMQKAAGGFSLWGEGAQEIWLTAYVAGFLQDARTAGFAVPDIMARRAQDWLLAQLQQGVGRLPALPPALRDAPAAAPQTPLRDADRELLRNGHRRFAELAHAAYVLAREQKAPLSTLRVLYDNFRDRARSPLPLVHLSLALRMMGDQARAQGALDDAMRRGYGIGDGAGGWPGEWLGDYGSALRDLALSYALLAANGVDHPQREALLNDVAGRLGGRRYLSTQEQMALLLAARAAGGGTGADWSAAVRTGGGERAMQGRDSESFALAGSDAAQGAEVLNRGSEPLFVELDLQGYPLRPPAPSANGIAVRRDWYEADGRPWNGRPLATGDTMVVRLQASADHRIEDALVVDRVPAGFEVENMNLSQGLSMEDWKVGNVSVADALSDPRIKHHEFRDDRYAAAVRIDGTVTVFYRVRVVTPGRFVVPAPEVEDMYRPEIRAVGEAGAGLTIE
ncbi:alpha-2-macroglobulin [Pigmentiphaga soli]